MLAPFLCLHCRWSSPPTLTQQQRQAAQAGSQTAGRPCSAACLVSATMCSCHVSHAIQQSLSNCNAGSTSLMMHALQNLSGVPRRQQLQALNTDALTPSCQTCMVCCRWGGESSGARRGQVSAALDLLPCSACGFQPVMCIHSADTYCPFMLLLSLFCSGSKCEVLLPWLLPRVAAGSTRSLCATGTA